MVFRVAVEQQKLAPPRKEDASPEKNNTGSGSSMVTTSEALKSHRRPLYDFSLPPIKWSKNHNFPDVSKLSSSATTSDPFVFNAEKFKFSDTKPKIFIRVGKKIDSNSKAPCNDVNAEDDNAKDRVSSAAVVAGDADETLTKTWNLRPRKPAAKNSFFNNGNGSGGVLKIGSAVSQDIKTQEPSRAELTRSQRNGVNDDNNNNNSNKNMKAKEKKVKFSIPLIKEEIEEDIYALTGLTTSRRPRKRPKHVQKQLDFLFPGLWLDSITPDSYRVPNGSSKG